MRKKLLILFAGVSLLVAPVFSQAAVIDVSAIAAAIENGLTMYQQLQTAYSQYQSLVQQLQTAQKNMANLDMSNIDTTKWDSMLKMTDTYMTQMDNIESICNKKNMKIGSVSFSLNDLYTTDVYEKIGDEVVSSVDPDQMTESDKRKFYAKHGLSPAHYNKLHALSKTLGEKAKEAKVECEAQADANKAALEIAGDGMNTATDEDSQTALAQRQLQTVNTQLQVTAATSNQVSNIADMLATEYAAEQERQTVEMEQQNNYRNEVVNTSAPSYVRNSVGDETSYIGPTKTK